MKKEFKTQVTVYGDYFKKFKRLCDCRISINNPFSIKTPCP